MRHYKRLSIDDREKVRVFLEKGMKPAAIARELGRETSTISREIKRNSDESGNYIAHNAQKKYAERKRKCGAKKKLENEIVWKYVVEGLENRWSPEQIAGRAKQLGLFFTVSCKTIYRALYSGLLPLVLKKKLRRKGRKRRSRNVVEKRGRIPDAVNIRARPKSADNRSWFGHWESDSVLGKHQTGCIGTHVERKSGFLIAFRLSDRQNEAFIKATIEAFRDVSDGLKRSFTVDNGKEFSGHKVLSEKTGMSVYFCDSNSPWQRGTNENTNGLLRQFFPKRSSFVGISAEELQRVVDLLNNRPRKRFNFMTPFEILRRKWQ